MCRVVSDDRPRRTTACVRYGEPIERAFVFFCHRCVGRCCTNRLHGCIVCECMESLCVYIVVHAHRANAFVRACAWARDDGNGWMDGVRAFMSSVVDARGDGRIRETHRARPSTSFASNASLPRLSRSRSLSLERRIHSFTHSLIHSVANERTNEGTNERTNDRTRSRGTRERRTRSTRSFASNSARARRGTRVCLERTTHRTHRIARAF